MAGWIPFSIQKRLLRYALQKTGLLDDKAIELEKLDITLGRQNVVELKDVELNVQRLAKLAQLPPSLRVETARVMTLKLTVPADIYQRSIVAEVNGVDVVVRPEEQGEVNQKTAKGRARPPVTARTPQHRKTNRRLRSPPPYGTRGLLESNDEDDLPTTQDLARSFLLDEPTHERRVLEASVAADARALEDSTLSQGSEGGELGTGAAVGLPGFLADFLQGIIDRLEVKVQNVHARLEAEVPGERSDDIPVTLYFKVGNVGLESLSPAGDEQHAGKRQIKLQGISLDLLSDAAVFDELSEVSSPPSASASEAARLGRSLSATAEGSQGAHVPAEAPRPATASTQRSSNPGGIRAQVSTGFGPEEPMVVSTTTVDSGRFADAGDGEGSEVAGSAELNIRPGEDNISWGSRRSQTDAAPEDLWSSIASEDDIPDSLLMERAVTPRPTSPSAQRTRRAVSPYDRSLQSPGLWPRLDESSQRHRMPQSPGSWPALDQSQHSLYQPVAHGPALEESQKPTYKPAIPGPAQQDTISTDNKLTAFKSVASANEYEPGPAAMAHADADVQMEDMAESRIFSHEEAESMYMSAMTQSPTRRIPGGWGSDATFSSEGSSSPPKAGREESETGTGLNAVAEEDDEGLEPVMAGVETPRAQSPALTRDAQPADGRQTVSAELCKQLLFVDVLCIWVPAQADTANAHPAPPEPAATTGMSQSHASRDMPGTFSAYSKQASSRRRPSSYAQVESSSVVWAPREDAELAPAEVAEVSVELGTVNAQFDIASGRLVGKLAIFAATTFQSPGERQGRNKRPTQESTGYPCLAMSMAKFQVSYCEQISGTMDSKKHSSSRPLVSLSCSNAEYSTNTGSHNVAIGRIGLHIGRSLFLSFDRPKSASARASTILTDTSPDLQIRASLGRIATQMRRPVSEASIETMPLNVSIDLQAIDEAFASFGGLSGVLELSNSVLSDSALTSPPPMAGKPQKGVYSQGDPTAPASSAKPEWKANAHISGVSLGLRGETCSVGLRTTTVKAVYREQGAIATISDVLVAGPRTTGTPLAAAASVDLSTLRMEYLVSPQDKDLERLLTLLTPSRDKYDSDDDILIDTLLRQRRKGAVLRLTLGELKAKVPDWACLKSLEGLAGELNKLSDVAKYLPEDERPGLLSLVRIKELEAQLPVNECFGVLQVACQDLHVAHVGLPALLALSIGSIQARRAGASGDLIHALIPLAGSDNLPMLMARMLGDEAEPKVKVKLFNVSAEYDVPTVLALTGLGQQLDVEELVVELAKSVASLALPHGDSSGRPGLANSPGSDVSAHSIKRTKIDVLLHDSAIGLTPQKLPSKALIVLSDARLSTLVPAEETVTASLEFRKAAIFITDSTYIDETAEPRSRDGAANNTTTNPRVIAALSSKGYVSVGSVMSAKVDIRAWESPDAASNYIEVDLRNELFLLETCADSMQTLVTTLSGLALPTPPSKQPIYRTQPMSLEDMIQSFTGDAYAKPEWPAETLFDVEEEPEIDAEALLAAQAFGGEADELLAESEMASSLYGPVSDILGGDDEDEEPVAAEDECKETAESLLEEDPFEMPSLYTNVRLSDSALLRDLAQQCKPAVSEQTFDLGIYEIEDLGFDALRVGQHALGTEYRFSGPTAKGRKTAANGRHQNLPLKLRLRDFHIIWNLYDGYDWQKTRDGITQAVEQVEMRAEERKAKHRQSLNDREDDESVIGDLLFNSIYIGVPSAPEAQDLRRQINRHIDDQASETESVPMSGMSRPTNYSASGRPIRQRQKRRLKLERSKTHKIAFELKGVSADVLMLPPDSEEIQSSIDVRVRDFEIFDNVPTSTWRKFLTQVHSEQGAREMSKPMAHIELLNVRTIQDYAATEIVLRISLLPLRLHVDQDALDFITRFFEFKDENITASSDASEHPFLQRVEVETVDLCLDYKPKKVDYGGIRSGHTTEFMNFIILDAAKIRLKHAIVYGVKGFEPLHKTLNDVWMPDVKRNQLPQILSGLAPVRSLVNIGTGVRDVVAIPIREYRKDGRLVRSIHKGAFHFGKTTASELARLGAKVAIGTQNILTGAEGFLTPTSASPSGMPGIRRRVSSEHGWHDPEADEDEHEPRAISAYADQPLGVLAGLRSARRYLEHDLLNARDALIAVQGEVLESATPGGFAAAVAKHAPTVILRPVIGASRAVGATLLGVGNQIDQGNVKRVEDKYKRR